jgi:hypothetical protein
VFYHIRRIAAPYAQWIHRAERRDHARQVRGVSGRTTLEARLTERNGLDLLEFWHILAGKVSMQCAHSACNPLAVRSATRRKQHIRCAAMDSARDVRVLQTAHPSQARETAQVGQACQGAARILHL